MKRMTAGDLQALELLMQTIPGFEHFDSGADGSTTVVLRNKITELAHCIDPALSIHDFRMVPGPTHTNLIFDVVTPFGFRLEDAEVARQLRALIRTFDSHYVPVIQVEHSYI